MLAPVVLGLTLVLGLLAPTANGLSPHFFPCQVQKPANVSPLLGCPPGTIFVSQSQTKFAKFHRIQDAISAL